MVGALTKQFLSFSEPRCWREYQQDKRAQIKPRDHLRLACSPGIIPAKCESESVTVARAKQFRKRPFSVNEPAYGLAGCISMLSACSASLETPHASLSCLVFPSIRLCSCVPGKKKNNPAAIPAHKCKIFKGMSVDVRRSVDVSLIIATKQQWMHSVYPGLYRVP